MMLPMYETKLFTNVWPKASDFVNDWAISPWVEDDSVAIIGTTGADKINIIYYLLYAKYGNSPIANYDVNQFKNKVFSIIFSYGPSWCKRMDLQSKIRSLSDDEIVKGGKAIYNSAFNPQTDPTTGSLEELNYINAQNTTNYKKSKIEAYAFQWDLIDTDVTTEFINKFRECFLQIVMPQHPLLYVTELEDDDEL